MRCYSELEELNSRLAKNLERETDMKTIKCYCGKTFKIGPELAKHRQTCKAFLIKKYHRTAKPENIKIKRR